MTPESVTRSRRQERIRAEILESARQLILERGPDGFSLREVAARADYTPGALYTYFASADDLLGAIAMQSLQVLGGVMTQVPTDLPAPERCVALGEAYLRFAAEHPEEYAIVFERLTVPSKGWEQFAQMAWPFTVLGDAFAAGVDEGAFETGPMLGAPEMAYGLWCIAHGAAALKRRFLAALPDDMTPIQLEVMRAYVRGLVQRGE